ncbi:hypothetical protein QAD02_021942 [Eretmocerus hayati]|uniref:Uncharacterized protein n=1 Tax=Eretmocerus hayati TaxID=131215 RepID=A0ACC2PSR0_9HYME|nr:hypothetical protein QAD02_021942 [Eretmocerus hayati]
MTDNTSQPDAADLDWSNIKREDSPSHEMVPLPQMDDQRQQNHANNPPSVITSRRHVRTITTTGHITETLVDSELDSPMASEVDISHQEVQNHQHDPRHVKHDGQGTPVPYVAEQQQQQQQSSQYHVHTSQQQSPDDQQRLVEQQQKQHHIIYATSNGRDARLDGSKAEASIAMSADGSPRFEAPTSDPVEADHITYVTYAEDADGSRRDAHVIAVQEQQQQQRQSAIQVSHQRYSPHEAVHQTARYQSSPGRALDERVHKERPDAELVVAGPGVVRAAGLAVSDRPVPGPHGHVPVRDQAQPGRAPVLDDVERPLAAAPSATGHRCRAF